jgi:cytochrome c2
MRRITVGIILLVAVMAHSPARTRADELTEGAGLYQEQCSACHGTISSEAGSRFHASPRQPLGFPATMLNPERGITAIARRMMPEIIALEGAGRFDIQPAAADDRMVVVPPYGPPLRGVVGRLAGSVEGFAYSQAFKRILQGVTWNPETLERWITDSQAWVPGSMMFYQQTDPETRHKIIIYLEANR